ncbi:inorganic phosphate transporter [Carboxydothermus islandicus]|uniref:Inorganic phosphate transporter n=1 Tax=Carboxydothermus islandicus TaxID=661089 RepID=A0A1L8CZU2_9THEO|nr:inorganic phosphate transporter [Carboxydothermus islandicus]GAV24399.1 inorganic phosphate transporter [Carboxydothermus islandicus]
MLSTLTLVVIVTILALTFDFVNGFHDTANAVATSVTTRALSPKQAVLLAGILNFVGAVSGTAVAKTIGKGIVQPHTINQYVIIAALVGAITWNLITWYYGLPSSSSHALIGGLIGATIAGTGVKALLIKGILEKVLLPLVLSPIIGFSIGFIIMTSFFWIFDKAAPFPLNMKFRKLQVLSAAMASFSHGSNDAQKSMGIITLALFSAGYLTTFEIPLWVKLACALAMGLGTYSGGWRIIKTMGSKIFRIEPVNGFAADLSSSITIYGSSLLGAPVSTTHVVASSILGVGSAKRFSGVNWEVGKNIVTAWVLTIPAAGLMAALMYQLISLLK